MDWLSNFVKRRSHRKSCRTKMRATLRGVSIYEMMTLERRLLLSFDAFISAPPNGGVSTSTEPGAVYTVDLAATGAPAYHWHVSWGDGAANDYWAYNYSGSVFPQPLAVNHSYANPSPSGGYVVTAAAYTSAGVQANATFALSSSFGNTFSSSGKSTLAPSGATNNTGYIMTVAPFSGNVYVAGKFNNKFGITRFNKFGQLDYSWGDQGTFSVSFDTGVDTPRAINVDEGESTIAVAGTCATGWAVASISTQQDFNNPNHPFGILNWAVSPNHEPGQPNALAIDDSADNKIVVVGTNGASMVALSLNTGDGSFDTSWGVNHNGIAIINVPGTDSSVANTIVETKDPYDLWLIGGSASYQAPFCNACCDGCCSGCCDGCCVSTYTASDFVLVRLYDDTEFGTQFGPPNSNGQLDTSFGNRGIVRTNFGNILVPAGVVPASACNEPSIGDADYSLVEWFDPNRGESFITAVGNTDVNMDNAGIQIGLAHYHSSNGALDTTFGTHGVILGPTGTAKAAVLANSNTGAIIAAGANRLGNDFQMVQFNSNGSLDNTFGNNGILLVDFGSTSGNSVDLADSIAVETDGSILVGGSTYTTSSLNQSLALVDFVPSNTVTIT